MATITEQSTLTKKQTKTFGPKLISGWGAGAQIKAEVRYDDECGNGHNSFAITGEIYIPGRRDIEAGGCLHEEIAKKFPELAKYIKWHLCSSDGPMHYVANTVYHASDRDHNGKAKGEPNAWEHGVRFNRVPVTHRIKRSFSEFLQSEGDGAYEIVAVSHPPADYAYSDNYTLRRGDKQYAEKWHECPFKDKTEASEFCEALNFCEVGFFTVPTSFSSGKARELDHARSAAIWPDATDEDLTTPGLEARLLARLPKLLEEFRRDMEELGFTW